MSTLSPKEFRLYVKAMAEEYKETNCIVQENKELYDDLHFFTFQTPYVPVINFCMKLRALFLSKL